MCELMSRYVIGFSVFVYSHSHLRSTRISSIYANSVQSTWRTSRVLTSTLKRNVTRRTSWWEDAALFCGLYDPHWLSARLRKGFTVLVSVRLLANKQKNAACHWEPTKTLSEKMHLWINHRQSTSNKDIIFDILYQLWLLLICFGFVYPLVYVCFAGKAGGEWVASTSSSLSGPVEGARLRRPGGGRGARHLRGRLCIEASCGSPDGGYYT